MKHENESLEFDLLDDEGYPTEEWLEFIKTYAPETSNMPFERFIETLRNTWWNDEWGFILHRKYREKQKLELHTGGWSGNEDIINAILENLYLTAFKMRYVKWVVGGHYYFSINIKS